MDFNKLVKPETEKVSKVVDCVLRVNGQDVSVSFPLDTDKAKLTKTGKEYYISVMGSCNVKIDGRDTACRFQGNLYLK